MSGMSFKVMSQQWKPRKSAAQLAAEIEFANEAVMVETLLDADRAVGLELATTATPDH